LLLLFLVSVLFLQSTSADFSVLRSLYILAFARLLSWEHYYYYCYYYYYYIVLPVRRPDASICLGQDTERYLKIFDLLHKYKYKYKYNWNNVYFVCFHVFLLRLRDVGTCNISHSMFCAFCAFLKQRCLLSVCYWYLCL
jgi:hypothetical protein